ncbi:MAG: endonuclease, partial [Treponemataceae bacterium]|nr:endonuclease [Treponemataceae bacterium]
MTKTQRIRMTLDIVMTLLSVALMGGTVLFPSDKVHQVLGMVLFVLWAAHVALNRRWCASLCKGTYPPYRVMQLFVNAGI